MTKRIFLIIILSISFFNFFGCVQSSIEVIFETNGGTLMQNVSAKIEEQINEPRYPRKDGYAFEGWYYDQELTKKVSWPLVTSKSITIYAKWTSNDDIDEHVTDEEYLVKYNSQSELEYIESVFIIYNENDVFEGFIFKGSGENQFTEMSLTVILDGEGIILFAGFDHIVSTMYANQAVANIQSYIGSSIRSLIPVGDIVASGSYTGGLYRSMLAEFGQVYGEAMSKMGLEYYAWFSQEYEMIEDSSFIVTNRMVKKVDVFDKENQKIAEIYYLTGSSIYNDFDDIPREGSITVGFGLSLDGTIIGIDIIESEFHHTMSFRNRLIDYLSKYIGSKIEVIHQEPISGATYSTGLAFSLMEELKTYYINQK